MFDSGISAKELIDELKDEVDIAVEIPDSSYVSWLNSIEQLLYSEIIQEKKERTVNTVSTVIFETDILGVFDDMRKADKPRFEDIQAIYAGDTQLIKSSLTSGKIFPNTYYKDGDKVGLHVAHELSGGRYRVVYNVRPALKKIIGSGEDMIIGQPEREIHFSGKPEDGHKLLRGESIIKCLYSYGSEVISSQYEIYGTQNKGYNFHSGSVQLPFSLPDDIEYLEPVSVRYYEKGTYKFADVVVVNVPASNDNIMVPVEFIDLVKAKLRGEAYKLVNEDGIAAKWLNDYNMLLETFKAWVFDKSTNFGI